MFRKTQKKNRPRRAFQYGTLIVGLLLLLTATVYIMGMPTTHQQTDSPPADAPYRQANVPVEDRIEDLLQRMTLEEKIGQMALIEKNSVHTIDDIKEYGLGALLSGFGGKPDPNTPQGWQDMVANFTKVSKESRLGIPLLYGVDAVHGHSNVPGATVFPHQIALGAAHDPVLTERVARATAREVAATGIYWNFGPALDLPYDIRWGRTYESFSDDPAVTEALGGAYIRGFREAEPRLMSTAKHYVGAGAMVWGSSSNEHFHIDQGTTPANERALREAYLPPFEHAVREGVESVMVGLNSWGEIKVSADKRLITDVLKGEMGFTGFVVSDWYGVYEIPGGEYAALVTAINAGVDMVMLPFDYASFVERVARAVRRGDISEERINDAVRRILRAKFTLGLFEKEAPSQTEMRAIGSPEHRALAREAVARSLVLLKEEGDVLPIGNDVRHIRVAGSAAHNVGRQSGAWTVEWQGIDGNWLPGSTSILDGIRARAGAGVRVEHSDTADFAEDDLADLGIAIVGEKPYAEGWGDTERPALDAADLEVISKLTETSERVVVVIVAGRPLFISGELPKWDAAVMAWLPGSEGAGIADVLFGDRQFMGRLPLPWPRSVAQVPFTYDGRSQDGTLPLFPRGFGLVGQ